MLLFELECIFATRPFLGRMYKAFFLVAYYGMFRVGELASGNHPVKAKDIHIAQNKDKIMFVLYDSKHITKQCTHKKSRFQQSP